MLSFMNYVEDLVQCVMASQLKETGIITVVMYCDIDIGEISWMYLWISPSSKYCMYVAVYVCVC